MTSGSDKVVGQILAKKGDNCTVSSNVNYASLQIVTCNVPTSFISSLFQNPAANKSSVYLALNTMITMHQAGFKSKTPDPQTAWLSGCATSLPPTPSNVNQLPLSVSPISGQARLTVKFSFPFGQYKDAPQIFFGDGTKGTMACPRDGCVLSHTYTWPGTYIATVALGGLPVSSTTITALP
jgi:hypothetical protein